jgi:RNA-directed DNA polymerase
VDCDLKSYFVDGNVLALIQQSLKAGVLEELKGWQPTERGTPQGAVISPLLANLYLNPLDHEMARRGWEMVRYADDFVVLCRTREEADAVRVSSDRPDKAEVSIRIQPPAPYRG